MHGLGSVQKNIPILCYHENEEHEITSIKRFFNVAHLPVHLFTDGKASSQNEYGICQKLEEFLDSRLIPYNRQKFKDLLTELDLNSAEELAKKSFYLSLSDQYWVCDANDMGKSGIITASALTSPTKTQKWFRWIPFIKICILLRI